MKGAIIGDIVGSIYEWHNIKTKDFPLFAPNCFFTDDSIMTMAVGRAFMNSKGEADFPEELVYQMRLFGHMYPHGGYGGRFKKWLREEEPHPYNSFGNGAAMRCSPAGLIASSLEEAEELGQRTAEVTHNHPEGIKGAEATASAIFLARTGSSKSEIKAYIESNFHYDLSRTCDEIRPTYRHVESCQETVPEAITAFLEGDSFEDVIRTAVSLGGDCDTLTAIAGSIAEGFYGVPEELKQQCRERLPEDLRKVLRRFEEKLHS